MKTLQGAAVTASDRDDASLIEKAAARLLQNAGGGLGPSPVDAPHPPAAPAERPAGTAGQIAAACGPGRIELDFEALNARGLLTPQAMGSPLAEEVRLIKRSVLKGFLFRDAANANVAMVTSALPGEGKTYTAFNLAVSIASELDLHVLLVDADLARPSVLRMLGVPDAASLKGLSDYLRTPGADLGDYLMPTNIPRLTLLPSGAPHDMSTELLASERMRAMVDEAAQRYADRFIIFDSGPVLATSQPTALFARVHQVVFVVEAGRTSKRVIDQALEVLGDVENVGLVLNKSRHSIGGTPTGTYYGYGYGYRADHRS